MRWHGEGVGGCGVGSGSGTRGRALKCGTHTIGRGMHSGTRTRGFCRNKLQLLSITGTIFLLKIKLFHKPKLRVKVLMSKWLNRGARELWADLVKLRMGRFVAKSVIKSKGPLLA